jgi:8-oxo-dGTP diphosphatase
MKTPILYGAVHLLFYREPNEILLLKRQNTGFEDGKWSVVAGRIESNEEVKSAAIREALEEASVIIDPHDLEVVGIMHRKNKKSNTEWIDFYFKVHRWQGEILNAEPNKCEELTWFNLKKLPENIIPYIRTAILKDQNTIWFDSLGWGE